MQPDPLIAPKDEHQPVLSCSSTPSAKLCSSLCSSTSLGSSSTPAASARSRSSPFLRSPVVRRRTEFFDLSEEPDAQPPAEQSPFMQLLAPRQLDVKLQQPFFATVEPGIVQSEPTEVRAESGGLSEMRGMQIDAQLGEIYLLLAQIERDRDEEQ